MYLLLEKNFYILKIYEKHERLCKVLWYVWGTMARENL